MGSHRIQILAGLGLLVAGLLVAFLVGHQFLKPAKIPPSPTTQSQVKIGLVPINTRRATDYSTEEMAAFAERFEKAFKPAIKKWCLAYQGRIPFKLEAVTPDKFHSRLAGGLYTFMIDGTTLTISDSKQGTRVFYMMTQEAAHDLNTIGVHNGPRNLTVPVTREEVLRMVKADTGVDFQPNQVEIKPTAAACAVDGGAFVEVGRQVLGDLEIMTGTNISFVVAADGKLICYQH